MNDHWWFGLGGVALGLVLGVGLTIWTLLVMVDSFGMFTENLDTTFDKPNYRQRQQRLYDEAQQMIHDFKEKHG